MAFIILVIDTVASLEKKSAGSKWMCDQKSNRVKTSRRGNEEESEKIFGECRNVSSRARVPAAELNVIVQCAYLQFGVSATKYRRFGRWWTF